MSTSKVSVGLHVDPDCADTSFIGRTLRTDSDSEVRLRFWTPEIGGPARGKPVYRCVTIARHRSLDEGRKRHARRSDHAWDGRVRDVDRNKAEMTGRAREETSSSPQGRGIATLGSRSLREPARGSLERKLLAGGGGYAVFVKSMTISPFSRFTY